MLLTYEEATEEKNEVLAAVEEHDAENEQWIDRAVNCFMNLPYILERFTPDEINVIIEAQVGPPEVPQKWGPFIGRLQREHLIQMVQPIILAPSRKPGHHGTRQVVYESYIGE